MMKQLVTISNDEKNVLRKPCSNVTQFGKELIPIINNMFDIMYQYKGCGLAAPQVGVSKKIIIIDEGLVFINPEIVEYSEEKDVKEEGCLSVPGEFKQIERSTSIKVRYQDMHRKMYVKVFFDQTARIIQHEVDHLSGKWII